MARDIFTSDIYIKGKYATYLKFLSQKTEKLDHREKTAGVLERHIDVYMVGAVIGACKGLMRGEDNISSDTVKIFSDVVSKEESNLKNIFRMVLLVDNSGNLSADEKIHRAFRTPEDPENMKIFNSYVRGGIEWLYEQVTYSSTTKDEYLEKIYDIVTSFAAENDISIGD